MSAGNINWAFGDGGDVEDLADCAERYEYSLSEDGRWREDNEQPGKTDEEMWQYIWDRRESEAEYMALGGVE